MKKFLITYSERRSVTVEVEAESADEAHYAFHDCMDVKDHEWEYWGEETEIDLIEEKKTDDEEEKS